jgi:glycosyltransferase involved in cell wall biosynthesis
MPEVMQPEEEVATPAPENLRTGGLRIALLTNIIPPFRRPLFEAIGKQCSHLRVFLSTPMEPNRDWRVDWEGLDVTVQRTATLTRRIGHNSSSDERQFVHFPIDTVPALLKFRPDAVLSSELGFRTAGAALYRLLRPKSRLLTWVCVSESTETQRGALRHIVRKLLVKGIDGFLVNGDSGARYLRSLGISGRRIFRAPYPTDIARFAGSEVARERTAVYRLVYAGRFVERKGLVPFVRTLARWAVDHPERVVEFDLFGSGPLETALREVTLPKNLRLNFRGFLAYEDMKSAYLAAGIFAFPSLADEWGTVVSEAMASGLPVLGSLESQAVEELVRDGVSGWVFHPLQEHDVYAAIDRCMRTPPSELSDMRRRAKMAALELSPQRIAAQVMQAVQDCLSEL